MKFYGRVRSERAEKGQGGKFLRIEVQNESRDYIATMRFEERDGATRAVCKFAPGVWVEAEAPNLTRVNAPEGEEWPNDESVQVSGNRGIIERHDPRTCENSVPCYECEVIERGR